MSQSTNLPQRCKSCHRERKNAYDREWRRKISIGELKPTPYVKGAADSGYLRQLNNGEWVGRIRVRGKEYRFRGHTRAAAEAALTDFKKVLVPASLRRAGGFVSVGIVQRALELLQPLDHDYRFERQTQAIKILEDAVWLSQDGLVVAPQSEPASSPVPPVHQRPAWLDALPMRAQ